MAVKNEGERTYFMSDYDMLVKCKTLANQNERLNFISDGIDHYLKQYELENGIKVYVPKKFRKVIYDYFKKYKIVIDESCPNYMILFYHYLWLWFS